MILTSDVALFTDLHKDNHSKASQGFWERVQNYFASKVIDSIQIYVLDSRAREGIPLGICDANENSIRLMISDISCTLRNTFVTNYTSTGSGMLDMKVVDSSLVILSKLLRQWLRKLIGGSHIEFELPETIDGSVCSIALDLEYKLLPYSLVSHEGFGEEEERTLVLRFPIGTRGDRTANFEPHGRFSQGRPGAAGWLDVPS